MTKKSLSVLTFRMINIAAFSLLLCLSDIYKLNAINISILIVIGLYLLCLGWYLSKKYYSNREINYNNNFRRDPSKPWWEDRN